MNVNNCYIKLTLWLFLGLSSLLTLNLQAKNVVKGGGFTFVMPEGALEEKKQETPSISFDETSVAEADTAPTDASDVADDSQSKAEVLEAEGIALQEFDASTSGAILGQVLDKETTLFISGVYVVLKPSLEGEGQTYYSQTDAKGAFLLEGIPVGEYNLSFVKDGYFEATIEGVIVTALKVERYDFGLVEKNELSGEVYQLTDFVVSAAEAQSARNELIQLRSASIGQVDFLSTEDFAKFGGSNIADLVKRIAGVNVVEGQFAVVRGLGDRYNSTLVNGLPVPSPDPIRQGVQLDLFPTSIVEAVVTNKAFLPSMPFNSSGAGFDLKTRSYPEEFEAWIEAGASYNENVADAFLLNPNGEPALGTPGGSHLDFGDMLGVSDNSLSGDLVAARSRGMDEFSGQSFKFGFGTTFDIGPDDLFSEWISRIGIISSLSYSSSASSSIGTQQDRFATNNYVSPLPFRPSYNGSLVDGELPASGFRYDLLGSEVSENTGFLFGAGVELDSQGRHKLDFTFLRSKSIITEAIRRANGFLPDGFVGGEPNLDRGFGQNINGTNNLQMAADVKGRGGSDYFTQGQDILTLETRILNSRQIAGDHIVTILDKDLEVSWGYASSSANSDIGNPDSADFVAGQSSLLYFQNVSGGTLSGNQGDYELDDPVVDGGYLFGGAQSIAEGFAEDVIRQTARTIRDDMTGWRVDPRMELRDNLTVQLGAFHSETERSVVQTDRLRFLPGANISEGATLDEFATDSFSEADSIDLDSFAEVSQEIDDQYFQFEFVPVENLELSFGYRYSSVDMNTRGNGALFDAFTLTGPAPSFTPDTIYGNPNITNGDLLGFGQTDADDLEPSGSIEEEYSLPSISIKYTFLDKWVARLAYSKTVALPSLRELTPIFTVDTFSGDRILGNPTLVPSEVENFGLRFERSFDDGVTMISIGGFYKEILDPIEQIGLTAKSAGGTPVQSFINNSEKAEVQGVEVEGRLGMGLVADFFADKSDLDLGFLEYFSIGGNASFIEATVGFPEEVRLTYVNENLKKSPAGDTDGNIQLPDERRLFDQPEWTVNFDVTFEQPDWGTRLTLALYGQSDVLSVVGTGAGLTTDQYTKEYEQLDLTFGQSFGDGWEFEFSIENITDSERGVVYDEEQVDNPPDRFSYKVGRSYGVSLKKSF